MTTKAAVAAPKMINDDVLAIMRAERLGLAPDLPIEPTPPGEFRVINALWHLPTTGRHAELARLEDGRLVARQVIPGQLGKPVILYWAISDDPNVNPLGLNGYDDELQHLHEALDRSRVIPKNGTGTLEPTPLEAEAQRFMKEWGTVASLLEFSRP
jgi:hypothetical protein